MMSQGKIWTIQNPGYVSARLYNFEVGKFDLKREHSNYLVNVIVPILRKGGSLTIIGIASRTGSEALNKRLSENRSKAVVGLLRKQVPNNFQVLSDVAVGENAAAIAGVPDEVEQEHWRGVIITVWDKPTPPPPPPPSPKPVQQPAARATDRRFFKRWLGIGVKAGGQLGIGGVESTTAYMLNLGDFETFDLKIISSRWGLGLGGSGGAVAVLGFGFRVPYELHGKSAKDWGVNVAITEKLISKSVLSSLESSKYLIDGFKNGVYVAPKMGKAFKGAALLQNIRNALHTVYVGYEASKTSGVVVIDLPLLGLGLEVSAFVTRGTMYVSNPSDWSAPVGGDRI